jgi:AraC-like DNA-binding protein
MAVPGPVDPPGNLQQAKTCLEHLAAPFVAAIPDKRRDDPRINAVPDHLDQIGDRQIKAGDMAGIAGLSEGRFSHLFRQKTGLPMRRYVLWRRIIRAVAAAGNGADLTTAAYVGGFSDQAHFSRVFRLILFLHQ